MTRLILKLADETVGMRHRCPHMHEADFLTKRFISNKT